MFYDGECALCRLAVGWLGARLADQRVALRPLQSLASEELSELGVTPAELSRALHVRRGRELWRGVYAVAVLMGELPGGRLPAAALLWSGRLKVGELAYAFVARHRHLLGRFLPRLRAGLPPGGGER